LITPNKPFFYFEALKRWEQIVIYSYIFITITLFFFYNNVEPSGKEGILIAYAIGTQLSLYFGLYTSLRNLKSYLIWCFFGLLHLLVYFLTKSDQSLEMARGNASIILINTIPLLILFQVLRYISLELQHREFVAPAHGGGKDLFENKKVTFVDFIIFIIYIGVCVGLFILPLNIS